MRFTIEESMAELSELAGTAGLEVAGSTYQRVVEPNPRTYIGTGKVRLQRGLRKRGAWHDMAWHGMAWRQPWGLKPPKVARRWLVRLCVSSLCAAMVCLFC